MGGCQNATAPAGASAADPAGADGGFSGPPVRFIGRVQSAGSTTTLSWGGTTVLIRFSGADLQLKMSTPDSSASYFDLFVDNGSPTELTVVPGTTTYPVPISADGIHQVRLIKRNEAGYGTVQFAGVSLSGKLLPTPTPPSRLIEFVGDSITNGYGALGTPSGGAPGSGSFVDCTASGANESASQGFAVLSAQALAADYALVAYAGRGVARNNDSSTSGLVPQLWTLQNPLDSSTPYSSTVQPDVVVINLGTNDFSIQSGNAPPANFVSTYVSFLRAVRAKYAAARIVVCLGPMLSDGTRFADGSGVLTQALSLVNQAISGFADGRTSFLQFATEPLALASDVGCEYHPNLTTQASMASVLTQHIKQHMGW
jgi:lysophospholipase L1-like esterase